MAQQAEVSPAADEALQEALDGFFLAAEYGRADVVKALADHARGRLALADIVDPETGRSPLHVAVANGKTDVLRVLLAAGFPPELESFEKKSSPTTGKHTGPRSAYVLAQQLQATDQLFVFHQFLIQQVAGDDVLAVKRMLKAGVDVRVTDAGTKGTLVHWAVSCQAMGVLTYLLAREDVQQLKVLDERNADGVTPLHVACQNGYVECVRLLLKHGADPTIQGDNGPSKGKTALELATKPEVQALFSQKPEERTKEVEAKTTQGIQTEVESGPTSGEQSAAANCGERRGSAVCPHEAQNSKLLLQLEEKDLLVNQLKKTIETLVEEAQEIQKLGEERVMLEYVRKLREEKAVVQQQLEDATEHIKDQQQQLHSLKNQIRSMCESKESEADNSSHTSDGTGSTAPAGSGAPDSNRSDGSVVKGPTREQNDAEEASTSKSPSAQALKLDEWTPRAQREQEAFDQHVKTHGADVWSTVWSGIWSGKERSETHDEDGEVVMTV